MKGARDLGSVLLDEKNQPPAVSVVVLSHNRIDELQRNLPGLIALASEATIEVIVVDNDSTDGSSDYLLGLQDRNPFVHVILNDRNDGVGAGRNLGWSRARGEWILNVDDDTRVDGAALNALLEVVSHQPTWGVISPRVVHAVGGETQTPVGPQVSNFHGACHLVRRAAMHEVGPLDEECSFGGEELDYSIRMRSCGWEVVQLDDVIVEHNSLLRVGPEGRRRRVEWARNLSRIHFKYFPIGAATMFTLRSWFANSSSGARQLGWSYWVAGTRAVLVGARQGLAHRNEAPPQVTQIYMNKALQPDFGNTPLSAKLKKKWA